MRILLSFCTIILVGTGALFGANRMTASSQTSEQWQLVSHVIDFHPYQLKK